MKEALSEHEIYLRVFGVANFEFEVKIVKNKMADPKWRQLFLGSLNSNLKSNLQKTKWRTQNGKVFALHL